MNSHPVSALAEALTEVEKHLERMSQALLGGEAQAVEQAGAGLRAAIGIFGDAARREPRQLEAPALRLRLLAANQTLASHRENLARRAAGVDRALTSILPSKALPTYSGASGLGGRGGGNRFGGRSS
jgi:hypothetical protein